MLPVFQSPELSRRILSSQFDYATFRVIACIEDPSLIAKILGHVRSRAADAEACVTSAHMVPDTIKSSVYRLFEARAGVCWNAMGKENGGQGC